MQAKTESTVILKMEPEEARALQKLLGRMSTDQMRTLVGSDDTGLLTDMYHVLREALEDTFPF